MTPEMPMLGALWVLYAVAWAMDRRLRHKTERREGTGHRLAQALNADKEPRREP